MVREERSGVRGYIVPGMPHPLLCPERNAGWASLRRAFQAVREEIERTEADLLVLYSTQWLSVIGHQIQADPEPRWIHVDQEWHELGEIPYQFRMDPVYAAEYEAAARKRGLHARTVAYHGFPIDTGTVVALKLLNPENRLPACVVSCNMYADRAETLVLGKAAHDALENTGKRAIAVAVTALSNRLFTEPIDPAKDRISSLKDDEWNRKILEILGEGRLEDVSQLARQFSSQAQADQKLKAVWWLAALMGQHNRYEGRVFDYQAVWGTGAALVGLTPALKAAAEREFDEEDVETYGGDRAVLAADGLAPSVATPDAGPALPAGRRPGPDAPCQPTDPADPSGHRGSGAAGGSPSVPAASRLEPMPGTEPRRPPQGSGAAISTHLAPTPVGAYPHARRVGELVYLSGVGPRQPGTNAIPGGPVRGPDGMPLPYDAEAQTRATIANVKAILEAAGSSLDRVVDVTAFLIDMDRDFAAYNRVYAETFAGVGATRTTLAVSALPTPIAVELKVIALAGRGSETGPTEGTP